MYFAVSTHLKDWLWFSAQQHRITAGILLSIAAAGVYELARWRMRLFASWRTFRELAGVYREKKRLANGSVEDTGASVELIYHGNGKFKTQAVHPQHPENAWRGEVFMRHHRLGVGEGWYEHIDPARIDAGTHFVIYQQEHRRFIVTGSNMSHPNGVRDFKMVWQFVQNARPVA